MLKSNETLQVGRHWHQAGDLQRAEDAYQRVLRIDPSHSEALHLLGYIGQQRGQYDVAVRYLTRAVDADPGNPILHNNLGAAQQLIGQWEAAEVSFRRAVTLKPGYADAHYNLGVVLHHAGQGAEAVRAYQEAIRLDPRYSEAHNNLGKTLQEQGELRAAKACFEEALRLRQSNAQAHFNLANVFQLQGRLDQAVAGYERALQIDPDFADVHYNLGLACLKQDRADRARDCFEHAIRCQANHADAHYHRGLLASQRRDFSVAAECFRRVIELRPERFDARQQLGLCLAGLHDYAGAIAAYDTVLANNPRCGGALNNRGLAQCGLNDLTAALASYDQAIVADPQLAEPHYNRGDVLRLLGKLTDAIDSYTHALKLQPGMAAAHNRLGVVYHAQGDTGRAREQFERALALDASLAEAHANLGQIFREEGRAHEAAACFARSLELDPRPAVQVLDALLLPPIYESLSDLQSWRQRLIGRVDDLLRAGVRLDPDRDDMPGMFYLAYQGQNDREINSRIARLYPSGEKIAPAANPAPRPDSRIRVGFISLHLHQHTIGQLVSGLIRQLSRDRFHVSVFSIGENSAETSQSLASCADEYTVLPRSTSQARQMLAQHELDVLFYPDIGMDPFSSTLAHTRFAPVQCVTWGHPVTTGIPTVDYFLSSELLEGPDADEHYTERLVQLRGLPAYYARPQLTGPTRTRADFNLPDHGHIYLCPQSLFKLHPEFDGVLAQILSRDPQGCLVLVAARQAHWNTAVLERLRKQMPDELHRVRLVPRQVHADFLQLLNLCDVMLDPLHFGGGNTTYEALALGVPIVTWPSPYLRGRVTLGCYRKMGVPDCIAASRRDYVDICVRLGTHRHLRHELRERILAAAHVLYEDHHAVREIEDFLERAVSEARAALDHKATIEGLATRAPLATDDQACPAAECPEADREPAAQVLEPQESRLAVAAASGEWGPDIEPLSGEHQPSHQPLDAAPAVPLDHILRGCTCPACGHHVAVPFYDGGHQPLTTLAWPRSAEAARAMKCLPLAFVRCVDCGHVYNSEFNYAEVPYSDKPNLMFNRGILWAEHLRQVRDLILQRVPPGGVVVEVGCGDGHLLRGLSRACPNCRYIGFDPSGAMDDGQGAFEARRELFEPRRHLHELRPDLIISRHVLEHLMNPLAFVQALAFAVSWNNLSTMLMIEVPCIDGVFATGRTVDFFYEHNSHFTQESLRRLLERCASEVVSVNTGYQGEVVYGLARFQPQSDHVRRASEALLFRQRASTVLEGMHAALDALARSGRRIAVWGGTGKAAAFINQYGLDAERFPLVVDSDPDKAGTHVPGAGQQIRFRDELKQHPAPVILIATQWRAADIVLEIEREGIACDAILLEHEGRLVDFHRDEHPYRHIRPRAA